MLLLLQGCLLLLLLLALQFEKRRSHLGSHPCQGGLLLAAAVSPVIHLVVGTVLAPPNIFLELFLAHNTLVLGGATSLLPAGCGQSARADDLCLIRLETKSLVC